MERSVDVRGNAFVMNLPYEEIVDIKPLDPKIFGENPAFALIYREMPKCYFETKTFSLKNKKLDKNSTINWSFPLKDMTV